MSNTNILVEIEALYNTFTKTEKKVADYVLNNKNEVPYLIINELATKCGVGETTISRFCKKLKISGYQEFRLKMSMMTKGQGVIKSTISGNICVEDNLDDVVNKIYSSNIVSLENTKSLLDYKILNDVIEKIIEADHIYFFGVGSSAIVALEACTKFMRITSKVSVMQDSHTQTIQASILNKNDVAIIFSFSGNTKDTIEIAKLAQKSGAYTVGVSKFKVSKLSKYIDKMLLFASSDDPMQGNSLSARMSQVFIINILYTEYYKRTMSISKHYNKITAQAVVNKLN